MTLARVLAARALRRSQPIEGLTNAIIFDSCPGTGGLENSKRAFGGLIRNQIIRRLVNFLLTLLHYYSIFMYRVFGKKRLFQILRDDLNVPNLLPWMTERSPRLYLFSKKDDMVPWQEVEEHANEASAKGFEVIQERFDDSPHVAHARAYPERYWAAMSKVWDIACNTQT